MNLIGSMYKPRYPLQPDDVIRFDRVTLETEGMQHKGQYLKLSNGKVVVAQKVALIFHKRSLPTTRTS